jgi:hypothetical protein
MPENIWSYFNQVPSWWQAVVIYLSRYDRNACVSAHIVAFGAMEHAHRFAYSKCTCRTSSIIILLLKLLEMVCTDVFASWARLAPLLVQCQDVTSKQAESSILVSHCLARLVTFVSADLENRFEQNVQFLASRCRRRRITARFVCFDTGRPECTPNRRDETSVL